MSLWYADSHHHRRGAQVQYQSVQVLPWIYLWPELGVSREARDVNGTLVPISNGSATTSS